MPQSSTKVYLLHNCYSPCQCQGLAPYVDGKIHLGSTNGRTVDGVTNFATDKDFIRWSTNVLHGKVFANLITLTKRSL